MNGTVLTTGVLLVFLASVMATIITAVRRGPVRRWAAVILVLCAPLALFSWTRNGRFQAIHVDSEATGGGSTVKIAQHRPLHFHEFVHYYFGPKYFRELGYLGLYGCITLRLQG